MGAFGGSDHSDEMCVRTTRHAVLPCHAMSCYATPCNVTLCNAMPYHAVSCHAIYVCWSHAMPCHVILYHQSTCLLVPCHAMPRHSLPSQYLSVYFDGAKLVGAPLLVIFVVVWALGGSLTGAALLTATLLSLLLHLCGAMLLSGAWGYMYVYVCIVCVCLCGVVRCL